MFNKIAGIIRKHIVNRKDEWLKLVSNDGDVRYVLGNDDDTLCKSAHIQRYLWAKQRFKNKRILDAGCGSGYGAYWLAENNISVLAVDLSKNAIKYAQKEYQRPNLTYKRLDLAKPGIALDYQFDVIISFDVLEHIHKADVYLANLERHTAPSGVVIVGTPNWKMTPAYNSPYTELSEDGRWNPYHIREYTPEELSELLKKYFASVTIMGQRISDPYIREKFLKGSGYCPFNSLTIDDQDVKISFGLIAICSGPLSKEQNQ